MILADKPNIPKSMYAIVLLELDYDDLCLSIIVQLTLYCTQVILIYVVRCIQIAYFLVWGTNNFLLREHFNRYFFSQSKNVYLVKHSVTELLPF